jgi:hypothetical protein
MKKARYSFAVLRYVHDPATEEFANVGIALYSKERRYLNAICTNNYGRIAKMFGGRVDGNKFRQSTRHIQERLQGKAESRVVSWSNFGAKMVRNS